MTQYLIGSLRLTGRQRTPRQRVTPLNRCYRWLTTRREVTGTLLLNTENHPIFALNYGKSAELPFLPALTPLFHAVSVVELPKLWGLGLLVT